MRYDFFAYIDRMKYIKRWQLIRSMRDENIMEHSYSVALFTHALVSIDNELYGGKADVLKAVLYAMYHEASEVITGDLPTPVKYHNRSIHGAYKELERSACEKIVTTLPKELQESVAPYVLADEESEEYFIVGSKEADPFSNKISNESPIAKAILGFKVGDIRAVESPNGSYNVKILEIA